MSAYLALLALFVGAWALYAYARRRAAARDAEVAAMRRRLDRQVDAEYRRQFPGGR